MSLKILNNDELLTEDEARAEVGIKCTRTLRRWRVLRQGPPHLRIGRKVYSLGQPPDAARQNRNPRYRATVRELRHTSRYPQAVHLDKQIA